MKLNRVLLGDAHDALPELPAAFFDAIITDPPYNISNDTRIVRNGGKFGDTTDITNDFGDWDHGTITPASWIPLATNLLTENGVFISFYDSERITDLVDALKNEGLTIRHVGAWHKTNPPPQVRKVKWQHSLELFVIATMNEGTGHHFNWEEGQRHDLIETPICMGNERLDHPTQKRLQAIEPLIQWWTFPGDKVLDPFCGTGTTLVAAQRLGREWLGIEINERYVSMAENRLRNEMNKRLEDFA